MSLEQRDWLSELGSPDASTQNAALASLRDYLRRALAKGFGRQLADGDLDELAQEAIVRVHEKKDAFNGQSRFTTWAAAIAVNLALGELRRRRFKDVSLEQASASGRSLIEHEKAPDDLRKSQLIGALRNAIRGSLSERQQEALFAKLSGMPMAEIARRQNMTKGALYKLLHDARKRLRTHLEAQGIFSSDLESMTTGGLS